MAELLNMAFASSVLLTVALGLGVVFGLMGVINLAHGEFLMLGAYGVIIGMNVTGNYWVALVIATLFVAAIALPIERGLMRRLYRRPLDTIVATWGLAIVLRELVESVFGNAFRDVVNPLPGGVSVAGTVFPVYRLLIIGAAIVLIAGLWAFQHWTALGLRARAVMQNPELADALGINVKRVYMVTFAFGAGLAGLVGGLLAPGLSVFPDMGTPFVVSAFLVVLVGGLGSLSGMVVAAVILGIAQSLVADVVSPIAGAIAIVLLAVIVMRFAPSGLASFRQRGVLRRPQAAA